MTGLESVMDDTVVRNYMEANALQACSIMPGWKGWDVPHMMNMMTGGIVPTSPEMLRDDAHDWRRASNAALGALRS